MSIFNTVYFSTFNVVTELQYFICGYRNLKSQKQNRTINNTANTTN